MISCILFIKVHPLFRKNLSMSKPILVAYVSRTGTTAGVAQAIGQTLAESGALVDVRRMQGVTDLSPYRAVVAGSGIQNKQWLPEAMQFMRTQQATLARVPCAIFLVCMTLAMNKGDYRQEVAAWLQPVRALVRPVSEGLFAGALDISKVPSFKDRLGFKISVATGVWSEGDHRNWEAIHRWAASLPPLLEA
jgi:menaquinone-dependent protoporphyrinogen oxidase